MRKPLTEKQKEALATTEQWMLARRTYNALTHAVSLLTGYPRGQVYGKLDDLHELALLNTASAAMRLGVSVHQMAAVLVEKWKVNPRRQIDVPPIAWFTSVKVGATFRKAAIEQEYPFDVQQSRDAAISIVLQMEARKAGLFRGHSEPHAKTKKDLDNYRADCGTARSLCDVKEKQIRKIRIGYICR